ncbi:electron transfer flavoprotein subunit alpha/FixB family protein [Salibacter halophilus]|uniref:Electron transfer flavoprotein subunit alpha/FixB family protein n=1 Tax=Salibacter halophilus TaxID=1803916 RepID=A0A6N6M3S4_9FLAO|nr:electron transfer flavoprotein subunit alpha/FixB family protein [Salibacter halophilus]KAB1063805.1 electron transfer flavoprotein subunit alpha/FixB family protein [Salibacter halophilus]
MAVLAFVDTQEGKITKSSYEVVSYAAKVAEKEGGEAVAITYGDVDNGDLEALGKYGAKKVLINKSVTNMLPTKLAKLTAAAAEQEGADIIVFAQDFTGKSVAPILSAKLKAGLVSGAVDYPDTTDGFVVKKNVFSGKAFAMYKVNTEKKVISILPNSVGKEEVDGTAQVEEFSADLGDSRITVTNVEKANTDGGIPLTEADLVVSAGRGLKGPENWGMIEELANKLGAATACSRPVADVGWRPHHEHVGQTGIAIRPNLYIAVGISGAIQHLAGVNGSKVIVVINTDPEAPFFKAADYGIVGDAFEVVPKLNKAIEAFQAEN